MLEVISHASNFRRQEASYLAVKSAAGIKARVTFTRPPSAGEAQLLKNCWPGTEFLEGSEIRMCFEDPEQMVLVLPDAYLGGISGLFGAIALLESDPEITEVGALTLYETGFNSHAFVKVDSREHGDTLVRLEDSHPTWIKFGTASFSKVDALGGGSLVRGPFLTNRHLSQGPPALRALVDYQLGEIRQRVVLSAFAVSIPSPPADLAGPYVGFTPDSRAEAWLTHDTREAKIVHEGTAIRDPLSNRVAFYSERFKTAVDGQNKGTPEPSETYFLMASTARELGPEFQRLSGFLEFSNKDYNPYALSFYEQRAISLLRRIWKAIPTTLRHLIEKTLKMV
jgi:hypothetical protein